jgi:hypothetical protein
MNPATYNFPSFKRGNSIQEIDLATVIYTVDSSPVALSSGEIIVKDNNGCVFETWNAANGKISITGVDENIVTKAAFSGAETSEWLIGKYTYELNVTLQTGEIWSLLVGEINIT